MSAALAVSFIVAGGIAAAWAASMWKKRRGAGKNWVVFLMVLAGLGIGTGAGSLADLNILTSRVGLIPLWVIFVAVFGFLFVLEVSGWRDHPTRTPLLGAITALVFFAAMGHLLLGVATHELHQVTTTSTVRHGHSGG